MGVHHSVQPRNVMPCPYPVFPRSLADYIYNFVLVLFTLVLICPAAIVISFEDVQDRFAYVVALMLTAVAFKFITSTMVPKTAYLTYLDCYNLTCYAFMVRHPFGPFLALDPAPEQKKKKKKARREICSTKCPG